MKSVILLFLAAASAQAQVGAASLAGAVTDQSEAIVSGASVTLSQPSTGFTRKTLTGLNGNYLFDQAPPGGYVLTVEKPGFAPYRADGIILELNQKARQDVRLSVGAERDQVTVAASVSALDTESAATGYRLDDTKIRQLPLASRNVIALVTLG